MKIFNLRTDAPPQPIPPALPRPPVAPAAPRPASGGSRMRPVSQRSVGSAGSSASRPSTSSHSTPEPAEIGEDDCAVYGCDSVIDAGWGVAAEPVGSLVTPAVTSISQVLALEAAENRIRALEKQIQTERRLRKDAEESLAQVRSKLTSPVQASRFVSTHGDPDDDLLMDVGVQTDAQPLPGRMDIEREIEGAVQNLQQRNDALEIENQMLQSEVEAKHKEVITLKSDNKVLWAEQEAVRTAKEDFKDLQKQLASHIKAGNLITKRPSSALNRGQVAARQEGTLDAAHLDVGDAEQLQRAEKVVLGTGGVEVFSALRSDSWGEAQSEITQERTSQRELNLPSHERQIDKGGHRELNLRRSPTCRHEEVSSPRSPERQIEKEGENVSALSNFVDIFQGDMRVGGDTSEDETIDVACQLSAATLMDDRLRPRSVVAASAHQTVAADGTKLTVAEYRRTVSTN